MHQDFQKVVHVAWVKRNVSVLGRLDTVRVEPLVLTLRFLEIYSGERKVWNHV